MSDSGNISNQFWLDDKLSEEQKEHKRRIDQVERAKRWENRNRKSNYMSEDSENEVFFNVKSDMENTEKDHSISVKSQRDEGAQAKSPLGDQTEEEETSEKQVVTETGQEYFIPELETPALIERLQPPVVRQKHFIKEKQDLETLYDRNRNVFGVDTGSHHGRYDSYVSSKNTLRQSIDEIEKFRIARPGMIFAPTVRDDTHPSRGGKSDTETSVKSDKENEKTAVVEKKRATIKSTPEVMNKIDSLEKDRNLHGTRRMRFLNVASDDERADEISVILKQQAEVNEYKAILAEEKRKNEKLREDYKREMRKQRVEHRRKLAAMAKARRVINKYKTENGSVTETSHNELTTDVQSDWTEVSSIRSNLGSTVSGRDYTTVTQTESEGERQFSKTPVKKELKQSQEITNPIVSQVVQEPRVPIVPLQNRLGAERYSIPIRRALLTQTLNEDNPVVQGQRQKLEDMKKERYKEMYPSLFVSDEPPLPPSRGGGGGGGDDHRQNGRVSDGGNGGRKGNRGGGDGPPDSPSSSSDSSLSSRSSRGRRSRRGHRSGKRRYRCPKGEDPEYYIPPDYKKKFTLEFKDGTRDEYEMFKRQFEISKMCHNWNKGCERYELLFALEGKAAKRLKILSQEELKVVDNIWRVLDNAFLPAHYRRTIMAEFHALKRESEESMKAYYLNLVEAYRGANKTADDNTVREAVREVMLQNMDEEDYDVVRPYLHLDDPEAIANNYDSIILQLQRNNKGARKDSELEVVSKIKHRTSDSVSQTPSELSAVNINVVQPSSEKEKGTRTQLVTRPDNGPTPIIMMQGPPPGMGGPNDGQGGQMSNNANVGPPGQALPGTFPNGVVPPPAYAPLNTYSMTPNPIIINNHDPYYKKDDRDRERDDEEKGNQRGRNNYRRNNNYRNGGYRNNRGNGSQGGRDNQNRREEDDSNRRQGDKKVRFEDRETSNNSNGYRRRNRNRRDNSNFQCYNCGEWGHKAYQCEKKEKKSWGDRDDTNQDREKDRDIRTMVRSIQKAQEETQKDVDRLYKTNLKAIGLSQEEGTKSQTGILRN